MKFSVLMSVYKNDSPSHLKEALKSILDQSLLPSEIIIIGDGPLPESIHSVLREVVDKPSWNACFYQLEQNMGLGYALNYGIKKCNFNYIARMDSDDICLPNRFELQINYFKKHPNVDCISGHVEEFKGDINNVVSCRKVPISNAYVKKFVKRRCPMNHPAVMYKKDAVLAAGNYSVNMRFQQDYHLWIRMLANGAVLENVDAVLLKFRLGAMLKRRKGWIYTLCEFEIQKMLYENNMIHIFGLLLNSVTRSLPRLLPAFLVKYVYKAIRMMG